MFEKGYFLLTKKLGFYEASRETCTKLERNREETTFFDQFTSKLVKSLNEVITF